MRLMVYYFLVFVLVCAVFSFPNPNHEGTMGPCSNEYKRKMLRQHCGDFRRKRRDASYQFGKNHYGPIYNEGGREETIYDRGGAEIRISKRGKAHWCCGNKCERIYTCI